jgi:hypothetical protein
MESYVSGMSMMGQLQAAAINGVIPELLLACHDLGIAEFCSLKKRGRIVLIPRFDIRAVLQE